MWKYIKNNKLINLFNLIVLLLFFLPHSSVGFYLTEEGPYEWQYNFVYNTFDISLFYLILLVFTISFQITKSPKLKNILIIFNFIFCSFLAFYGIMSIILPIQDYMPDCGVFLTLTLAPILFIIMLRELKIIKSKTKNYVQE